MENDVKTLEIEQQKEKEKGTLTCRLKGWLDPNTSPELLNAVNTSDVHTIIFDMKDVEYVFSSGLRVFLQFQRAMDEKGGKILLINVSDSIRSIFEYTGFDSILEPKA